MPFGVDNLVSRPAIPDDSTALTQISFRSKRYWNYPEEYFDRWQEELTIVPDYIRKNTVVVWIQEQTPVAFYSLVHRETEVEFEGCIIPAGLWLDHMFIAPKQIGRGLGSRMFRTLVETELDQSGGILMMFADPNAVGFYLKMGCDRIADFPSSIPGRTTPMLRFAV